MRYRYADIFAIAVAFVVVSAAWVVTVLRG